MWEENAENFALRRFEYRRKGNYPPKEVGSNILAADHMCFLWADKKFIYYLLKDAGFLRETQKSVEQIEESIICALCEMRSAANEIALLAHPFPIQYWFVYNGELALC
jgi:hypothetical protein